MRQGLQLQQNISRRQCLQHLAAAGAATSGLAALPAWAQRPASSTATSTSALTSTSASAVAGAGLKLEKRAVQMVVYNKAALAYLPLTVAEHLGYFAAEGLELDIQEVPSLVRAQQLASSGAADMVTGWIENTLALQPKGQLFQAFVLMGRAPQIALGLSPKTMPNAKSLADLAGKKVGIMAPGTPSHTVAHAALSRAGLRLGDMGFVSVGTPAGALAALRAGQIDAISYTDPLITQLEQRGELRVMADTRTLQGTVQACGGEMPASCLYASPEFVQKHPATTQAVAFAVVRALKWLQTAGLSDLLKIVPEVYFAGDRALYLAAFARMREAIAIDGVISPVGVRNTLDAMRSAEPLLRMETIDPAKCFTNVFAIKAKQRFQV